MKSSRDVLASVLKTAQMGQTGIRAVAPYANDDQFRKVLTHHKREFDEIEQEAYNLAASRGWELDELEPIAKLMSRVCAHGSLAFDKSDSKIAAMMITGNTKGIIKGLKNNHQCRQEDVNVQALFQRLVDFEEASIAQMQGYL